METAVLLLVLVLVVVEVEVLAEVEEEVVIVEVVLVVVVVVVVDVWRSLHTPPMQSHLSPSQPGTLASHHARSLHLSALVVVPSVVVVVPVVVER